MYCRLDVETSDSDDALDIGEPKSEKFGLATSQCTSFLAGVLIVVDESKGHSLVIQFKFESTTRRITCSFLIKISTLIWTKVSTKWKSLIPKVIMQV